MAHESHGSVGEECVDASGVTASGGGICISERADDQTWHPSSRLRVTKVFVRDVGIGDPARWPAGLPRGDRQLIKIGEAVGRESGVKAARPRQAGPDIAPKVHPRTLKAFGYEQ